jgi:lipoprotein-anchoring transpeptidase ErfK/SrfK
MHSGSAKNNRDWYWLIACCLFAICMVGVLLLTFHSSFSLANVSLANISTDGDETALRNMLEQQTKKYSFTLIGPHDSSKTYRLADAGVSVDAGKSIASLHTAKQRLGWERFAWWRPHTVPLIMRTDDKKFKDFVEKNIATQNQAAQDASIEVSSGKIVMHDAVMGWTLAIPGGNDRITQAASTLTPLKTTLTQTSLKPELIRANLTRAEATIHDLLAHTVTLTLPDKTIVARAGDIGGWLDIQPVPAKKTVDVSINSGKVQAYLDKATRTYVHPPRSEITTTDAAGQKTVLIAGQNGTDITNKIAAAASVTNALSQSNPNIQTNLEVAYKQYTTINANDYDKWIVADVTTKRMYAFEHSTLVRTFLVSAGAPKTPTVLGTYQIYKKYTVKDMRGSNADGSRYFQPHVRYVNYFYRDYAIHGNYWRPTSYFGNINSSHGCVGITDSEAEWLYNWAPIGTTVITHA